MNKRLYKFVTHCVINLKYTKTNLKVLEMALFILIGDFVAIKQM